MSAVLDSIWESYRRASHALRIVRRVASNPELAAHATAPLRSTDFDGLTAAEANARTDVAQEQLNDQAVLSLYAAFESALRDHLVAQSKHLRTHATAPDGDFAGALAEQYEAWCEDEFRMNKIEGLFTNAVATVGKGLVGQVGQIRVYRHWQAHGKRGARPPQTTPQFAYKVLKDFLSVI